MSVLAVQAIRKMRGGSQSQLMLGEDAHLWVVKFQNNPQHLRILANELITTRLCEAIGLSVPAGEVIEVTPWLTESSPDMEIEVRQGQRERYLPGLQFGSKFAGGLSPGNEVIDYLPEAYLAEVRNLREFAGILCLDKWLGNCDGRQAVFVRSSKRHKYTVSFIDHGFCFNAGEWNFPDSPLRGVYGRNVVYAKVTGWESFEPWLTQIEHVERGLLEDIANAVPPEWYGSHKEEIERLTEKLFRRRSRVRELILSFRHSDREPFPSWG